MAGTDATFAAETPADFGTDPQAIAARWISELGLAEREHRPWWDLCARVVRRYRDSENEASTDVKQRRFALLWSNMETLEPAIFSRTPTAVVSRRWKDDDPVGRLSSEILERSLNFTLDQTDFAGTMKALRKDFLLCARGTAWVRYVPHMEKQDAEGGEQQVAPDGEVSEGGEPYDVVAWEEAVPDYVAYTDFMHSPAARTWAEVRWVSRRAFMTRDELVARFKMGKDIPLDHKVEANDTGGDDAEEQWSKAQIYEIWDKVSRKVIWISKAYQTSPLDQREDPLGLKDFFPCPEPALGTVGPNSIIPVPDYNYYRSQDNDIETLTVRIGKLSDALKIRGFYAAGGEMKTPLADLLAGDDNTLQPIESWAALSDAGGVDKLIAYLPIDMVAQALKAAVEMRQQLIQDVYQVTGISDIMRGESTDDETATAVRKKAEWGSSRVRNKQKELARYSADLLRIMGQIIASKYDPKTLSGMSNVQLFDSPQAKQQAQAQLQMQAQQAQMQAQAAQQSGQQPPPPPQPDPKLIQQLEQPTWQDITGLLRDNVLRTFRLDIENDSTIEPNDQDEKERRIEFITAVGDYVAKSIPAVQLMPEMLPVIAQGLLFLVRGFRVGREMEDVIEKALEKLQAAGVSQPQQQQAAPAHDPQAEQMKAQAAMVGANAKMSDAQTNQYRAQTDRFEAQAGAQIDHQRLAQESQQHFADHNADLAQHANDIRADLQQAVVKGVERHFIREMNDPRPIRAPTP